ncbi:MAG: glycosyl hydrolase, partial [Caldilineaceae bacterium]|nr:glycosyl hydrolase [Caldilineaceae bacterium]
LYTCGNHVFRSTDEGTSWEPISPDLTRADTSKLGPSGGPITKDTSGAEFYATIYTFRESPHAAGVFWAGSDDGLVHLSRDGGKTWTDVTPPDLPEWSFVRTVEPSPHDPASLYLAATRYKLDDPAPYLYKTEDYGQNWHKLTDGLPADDFVRVVRADPMQPGLLYAGTETGLYVSLDDGANWQRWEANFPVTPVYDLTVKDADLVVATHGRAFWIMDDLTPLRQLAAAAQDDGNRLFATRPAVRIVPDLFAAWTTSEGKGYAIGLTTAATFVAKKTATGHVRREFLDAGEGAPHGALLTYVLGATPDAETPITLTIRDADGAVVRSFTPKPADYDAWDDTRKAMEPGPWIAAKAGVHRFLWDLRGEGSARVPGDKTAGAAYTGALVLPGVYTVELTVGDATLSTELTVVNDPRSPASMDELRAQHELLTALYAKVTTVHK